MIKKNTHTFAAIDTLPILQLNKIKLQTSLSFGSNTENIYICIFFDQIGFVRFRTSFLRFGHLEITRGNSRPASVKPGQSITLGGEGEDQVFLFLSERKNHLQAKRNTSSFTVKDHFVGPVEKNLLPPQK